MRVAYQAADVSHPKGAEQARREQGNIAGQVISWQSARGDSFHRKGITREGRCRTVTIQTTRMEQCIQALVCAAGKEHFIEVIQRSFWAAGV